MRGWLIMALLVAPARGGEVTDLLFRARHAQYVQGDWERAIVLYKRALKDASLDGGKQATIHLRIAQCYNERRKFRLALDPHLVESIYAGPQVPDAVRRRARELRDSLLAHLPEPVQKDRATQADPAARNRVTKERLLRQARRFLDDGNNYRAFFAVHQVLAIDPEDKEALALAAELETRLSGATEFLRDPLKFVRAWTETRITHVAQRAENLLKQAMAHSRAREFNLAQSRFEEALNTLDACEFVTVSDRLLALRERVALRWRAMRRRELGKEREDPNIPALPAGTRRASLSAEYLNVLERMLAVVSSPEREYRIIPVQAPRADDGNAGWQASPPDFALFRSIPSSWSAAQFARRYLTRRVEPPSWRVRGNYLEEAGGLLMARNRPKVLDALQEAVKTLENPSGEKLRGRFLLVPVDADAIMRFQERFGEFREKNVPGLAYTIPARISLKHLAGFLRDQRADIDLGRDTFRVSIANGTPQTLFVGASLPNAKGYGTFRPAGLPVLAAHYGVLLDVYPLRDAGRTALGLRVTTRLPVAPLRPSENEIIPRFATNETRLFVDTPSGAIIAVCGLIDPFASAREGIEAQSLILLWELRGADDGTTPDAEPEGIGAEVSLRRLLSDMRDDPGPRRDKDRGFVKREAVEALKERATFLEMFLRHELKTTDITVSVEEAVARVPPAKREDAAAVVARLERESARTYVVRVQTSGVRTAVLQRWLQREKLTPANFGNAQVAWLDAEATDVVPRTERGDVFAPDKAWAKITARGLQSRHGLSARARTSPNYDSEAAIATVETRTITEGLRVTVRPYTWNGRLLAHVEIEIAALDSEVEEMALTLAVPSYRTRVTGYRTTGLLDFGHPGAKRTALVRGIPHPVASRPDKLTEIAIAISVRPVP